MKHFGLIALFVVHAPVSAVTLHCGSDETPATCGTKIVAALIRQGCNIDPGQIRCGLSTEDASNVASLPTCEVGSNNCGNPQSGALGGDHCANAKPVKIPRSEGVHNGYRAGLAGEFSRVICRE